MMKPHVADKEYWERYFEWNTSFRHIQTQGRHPRVIPIGNKNPVVFKSEIVRIETVKPVK